MSAYLIDHPPVRDQFYKTRNRPLTGCTVLHTAESVMDTVGPDTGAEAVAEFIRTRTTAGSYHDLADSDSWLRVVPLESGAYHDGTGSNNWALSLSFACSTSDWRAMTPEKRAAFLRNGARAFADQQAWRRAHGYPLTELRYITKAQSDAGMSGFIEHGKRDPGRRSDPGVAPPNLFPYDEWLDHCRAALAGHNLQEDDMFSDDDRKALEFVRNWILYWGTPLAADGKTLQGPGSQGELMTRIRQTHVAVAALAGQSPDIDETKLAAALAPTLVPAIMGAVSAKAGLTKDDVEAAIWKVLGSLGQAA